MKTRVRLLSSPAAMILAIICLIAPAFGGASPRLPQQDKTLAERLGYSREAKLLIVHADDLGMAHSVNRATIHGLETGLVSSGSIMVPCPWFPEIAAYAVSHPEADLGLHLTLTSEWQHYRWRALSNHDQAPSLFDEKGFLYPTEALAAEHISPRETEVEIRAQIERAIAFGVRPTHLDSHMGTLYQTKGLFETFLKVARDYRLPMLISREWFSLADFLQQTLGPNDIVIDRMISITPAVAADRWREFYTAAIKNLSPGVTEMIIHLGYDDDELRAATINHPDWGAAWRQRDLDFFTGDECRRALKESGVKLITWREIGKLLQPQSNTKTHEAER